MRISILEGEDVGLNAIARAQRTLKSNGHKISTIGGDCEGNPLELTVTCSVEDLGKVLCAIDHAVKLPARFAEILPNNGREVVEKVGEVPKTSVSKYGLK